MNPFKSIIKFFLLFLNRKITSAEKYIGSSIKVDNKYYYIFRHISVMKEGKNEKSSLLLLKFKFNHSSLRKDRIESFFQIPVFTGLPGFEGKLWTFCEENGYFQGIYQWENKDFIEEYLNSFALKFLEKKACRGSISHKIIENRILNDFIKEYMGKE